MKKLSTELKNIETTWKEPEQPLHTLRLGSTKEDGQLNTTASLPSLNYTQVLPENQAGSTSSKAQFEPLEVKDEKVAEMVAMAWGMFPTYGDDGSTLPLKIKVFQRVFLDYPLCVISPAFDKFFKSGIKFPLPADIINIIEPPKKEVSAAAYVAIKRRQAQGEYIWHDDEKNLLKAYEQQEFAKVKGGSDELREAQKQIANYKATLQIEGE